jgi:hypothetical protein
MKSKTNWRRKICKIFTGIDCLAKNDKFGKLCLIRPRQKAPDPDPIPYTDKKPIMSELSKHTQIVFAVVSVMISGGIFLCTLFNTASSAAPSDSTLLEDA